MALPTADPGVRGGCCVRMRATASLWQLFPRRCGLGKQIKGDREWGHRLGWGVKSRDNFILFCFKDGDTTECEDVDGNIMARSGKETKLDLVLMDLGRTETG